MPLQAAVAGCLNGTAGAKMRVLLSSSVDAARALAAKLLCWHRSNGDSFTSTTFTSRWLCLMVHGVATLVEPAEYSEALMELRMSTFRSGIQSEMLMWPPLRVSSPSSSGLRASDGSLYLYRVASVMRLNTSGDVRTESRLGRLDHP